MKNFLLFSCFLALVGCKTAQPVVPAPAPDAAFERLMRQASVSAGKGQYDAAGTLYAQALDRAKLLDRHPEIAVSALCLCAYAVNAEDAKSADSALRTYREIAPSNAPTELRAIDLAVRLSWLRGTNETAALQKLRSAMPPDPQKNSKPDEVDASLTCDEALLRQGQAKLPSSGLPSMQLSDAERQQLPQNIQIRYQVIRAWFKKDAADWRSACRAYAAIGNYAAARREAKRCAKLLNDAESASMAQRITEAMHDAHR